jgi:TonB family protein
VYNGEKGRVIIRFKIQRDGTLDGAPKLEASSGKKTLDGASIDAIRASAPFEHLPEPFKGRFIELRLKFYYNVRPQEEHP